MGRRRISVETATVSTRVPKAVLEEIERVVKDGHYMDVGDYLREVIRRDLEARHGEKTPSG